VLIFAPAGLPKVPHSDSPAAQAADVLLDIGVHRLELVGLDVVARAEDAAVRRDDVADAV
jgi:hypothetical protein